MPPFGLKPAIFGAACLALASTAATAAPESTPTEQIDELKRAVEALRAENRELQRRVQVLEGQRPSPARAEGTAAAASPTPGDTDRLEQRLRELEMAKTAQEDAVRTIIRDSVSTLGSKINESVALGGSLGFALGRSTDFSGERKRIFGLSSAEIELEIQANPWVTGHMLFEYVDGSGPTFTPRAQSLASGGDRVTIDTAYLDIGDPQRFPLLLSAGRQVLPFGISTGHPVADVLSVASPLTVEAFEMRQNMIGLALWLPTPRPQPKPPPVFAAPVRPRLLNPLLGAVAARLGYEPPPARPAALKPVAAGGGLPPVNVGIHVYDAKTPGGLRRHFGATAGYRTGGHCGRNYDELLDSRVCPWKLSADVAVVSSVFASRFLEAEYASMLSRMGRVPGASASIKATVGPYALVGEWNGATRSAGFVDDLGRPVAIRPQAWQVSLGYQWDWNPWVQEIGAQGTYFALGYSRSRGLAGVTALANAEPTLIGALPMRRLTLTAGEWVVDGLRVVLEYAREWDYPTGDGGTGRAASGWSAVVTYVW